ncbi:MAG: hypothetical protein A2W85_01130 [Bacteroidetes bacterium GWF2_41_31]|nr:MAG: hypothetical protein A2W85_01130 [Bacteroidetes bacterium GWF2_41_31]OFZ09734.1 MAG: hypothetical protein A2338_00705 [Bacteroidetes bacterium RIFOXYB12_FULL_41_6]
MKYLIPILLLISCYSLSGQTVGEHDEGTVSYATSQNVYVKFSSTKNIATGDTLFLRQEGVLVPALVVTNLSSISAVCQPIADVKFTVSEKIYTKAKSFIAAVEQVVITPTPVSIVEVDTITQEKADTKTLKQKISGRVGISSYSNFSNTPGGNSQRMRYTFSLKARNISNSRLSAETYLSFVHRSDHWDDVQEDVFNGLKIYALALNYQFSDKVQLWLGRKINSNLSSVGAIDGLQYEMKFNAFTIGFVAGSRPDYNNYSFNASLLQFGGYLSHEYKTDKGNVQSSFAIMEQKNSGITDRRFAYFQHSNTLLKNVYLFGSVEVDLYKMVNEVQSSTFNLSNLYLSVRYRVVKQLSLSLSYSNRQNVIYYETYKDIVERLLDTDAMQGYLFQVNYRPGKNIFMGVKTGYRFRKQDPRPTKNMYGYVTMNRVPGLNVSATVSATLLETAYMSGKIYSIGFNRELVPGKLDGGLNYRFVDYKFLSSESSLVQNMAELNLTWRIFKKTYCSFNFEGTFEKDYKYQRLYINLTQRF